MSVRSRKEGASNSLFHAPAQPLQCEPLEAEALKEVCGKVEWSRARSFAMARSRRTKLRGDGIAVGRPSFSRVSRYGSR